jgi:hypothetical protein
MWNNSTFQIPVAFGMLGICAIERICEMLVISTMQEIAKFVELGI